ncbi:MAG: alpha/beta hydrolase [Planctomycetota bacterium]
MQRPLARSFPLLLVALLGVSNARAIEPTKTMEIWPDKVPGEKGDLGEEKAVKSTTGKPIVRISNVSRPTISVFKPPKEKDTGAAVMICPGGGYNILAWDLEGTEVAEWLNSIGVTGIVLKYRVGRRKDQPKHLAPLQDAQRAMSLIRKNAEEWGIDPKRIGILGFSAGGHLSAAASTNFDKRAYDRIDEIDGISCRPDFTVLVYPAYLLDGEKLVAELPVGKETPAAFLAHAGDDGIKAEGSIQYCLALRRHNIPGELHVYPKGGHGFGLRPSENPVSTWPKRCEEWLKSMGLLQKR